MRLDPTRLPPGGTTPANRANEITIEPLDHGVDDVLGSSLVDLGGAALLTEYPVCENDGELNQSGTPHSIKWHGSQAKRGGTEGRRLTKLEADGGLRGVGNGVAGDPPRAAPRVLR
jgi:hypothetical protein